VIKQAQQALPSGIERIDQASAASAYAANTSFKGGDQSKRSKTVEYPSSGPVPVNRSKIVKVQTFELLSAQAPHPREIAQNR
jgi:hypothetical protein